MPLDEIAIIAVHRADEIGQGAPHASRKAAAKRSRLRCEFDGLVAERAEPGEFHINVRFYV